MVSAADPLRPQSWFSRPELARSTAIITASFVLNWVSSRMSFGFPEGR
jgi:hypothetical protein